MNSYVGCLRIVDTLRSEFEMPPDQNASQMWSTWFLMSPVIMWKP